MRQKAGRGFTLVEVLVALLLAAIVGVLSYRGLDSLLRAQAHLEANSARWLAVHRFLSSIEIDFRAAQARTGRDAEGTLQAAFIGQPNAGVPFSAQLALMRPNDVSFNSALPVQRVAYRLHEGQIEQLLWPAADLSPMIKPKIIVLLTGVSEFSLRYIATDGVWRTHWPVDSNVNVLPNGIELTLRMQDAAFAGDIVRVLTR